MSTPRRLSWKQLVLRGGLTMNYAEGPRGGLPLLLVHGQGARWQEYARALPALAESYHVIAVDCHGHGKTTWNVNDYAADLMADDLSLFIDRAFGEPCVVSGHSSGGLLAARLAARHPEMGLFGLERGVSVGPPVGVSVG